MAKENMLRITSSLLIPQETRRLSYIYLEKSTKSKKKKKKLKFLKIILENRLFKGRKVLQTSDVITLILRMKHL